MKKLISLFSALTLVFTMFTSFAVNADASDLKPTMYLEIDENSGTKTGETVTIYVKYKNFGSTPYDDNTTGSGYQICTAQVVVNVPGGIAASGEQFARGGSSITNTLGAGSFENEINMNDDYVKGCIGGPNTPMGESGTMFTIVLKLAKDITENLTFSIQTDATAGNDAMIGYDIYDSWELIENHTFRGYDVQGADGVEHMAVESDSIIVVEEPTEETYAALPGTITGFAGSYYYKGAAIALTAENVNGKVVATNADTLETKSTTKTVAQLLGINTAGAISGSVVPVLVLSNATGPAFTFSIQ